MNQPSAGPRMGDSDFVFDSAKTKIPRRIVRLAGDESSEAAETLATFEGAAVVGAKCHAELQRLAAAHPGQLLALEWLGNLGWVRYVTCMK